MCAVKIVIEVVKNGYYVRKYRGETCTAKLVFSSKRKLILYLKEAISDVPIR